MKLKALLAVFFVLSVQSMHALKIVFVNNFYGTINARVDIDNNNGSTWSASIRLNPQDTYEYNYANNYAIDAIKIGYRTLKWKVLMANLVASNIPVTGNHTITISVNNIYGIFGIKVDGGREIGIDGQKVGTGHENIAAAAA